MRLSTTLVSITLAVSFVTAAEAATCSSVYGQCGGLYWTGPKCCESGSKCLTNSNNQYYSQCVPDGNGNKPVQTTVKPTTTTTKALVPTHNASVSGYSVIPGGISGKSETTRYWDCCKPSCGWNGKAHVTSPVKSCAKNGVTVIHNNIQSGCAAGGSAYVCNDNQPWAVNDNLAYGFAAASISGQTEGGWCCSCVEMTFTSGPVAGKKMVVQITNTGDDLGEAGKAQHHFDLLMPGGGVGLFNGCQPQWNAPTEGWGVRYGGIWAADQCKQLPAALQPGCNWRYGWFKGADNPNMTFKEVTCPAEIIARSGCSRR
ncbi:RlpA-like double-psi beta-barrel-protein domain-containing protein-containing protein [Helicostylum pulchrum]|nr:RlpA-like double-psi beta-barrel-protein domain-containing protein-containing protein [Helicostylum pulchrum]